MNSSTQDPSNNSSTQNDAGGVEMTVTIIENPEATMTLAKEGEVAQIQKGSKGVQAISASLPYCMVWCFACIALGMVML